VFPSKQSKPLSVTISSLKIFYGGLGNTQAPWKWHKKFSTLFVCVRGEKSWCAGGRENFKVDEKWMGILVAAGCPALYTDKCSNILFVQDLSAAAVVRQL